MTKHTDHTQPILHLTTLRSLEKQHANLPLMERAGTQAAIWAQELCNDPQHPVLILAGPGNNGGDAFVTARVLMERYFDVHIVFAGISSRLPKDALTAYQQLTGVTWHKEIPRTNGWGLVIDGLFGIGGRAVNGQFAELLTQLQEAARISHCPLLALDCPSGLDSESGRVSGSAIVATHTLSFLGLKPGLLTGDGPDHCGMLRVANLDIEIPTFDNGTIGGNMIARENFAACLTPRRLNSHKGTYGTAGILGGAPGMLGAALLAGRAALHMGAGRIFLGLLDQHAPGIDPQHPELMLRTADDIFSAPLTALAIGPGMGTQKRLTLMEQALDTDLPLVLDADALNLVSHEASLQQKLSKRQSASVLTPHPAEAARLLKTTTNNVEHDRLGTAIQLAAQFNAWVVLKGCGSIVASPEGSWWINATGNPGLATAGSGDVLAGLMVALIAQGFPIGDSVRAAVHLHGLAADDLAAKSGGCIGLCASELPLAARRRFNAWIYSN